MRAFILFATAGAVLGLPNAPVFRRQQGGFQLKNGQDAIALNNRFATLNQNSPCNAGENACVNNGFAQCVGGRFVIQPCAPGTICAALPLVNSPGTSVTCTTAADRDARIAATGATGAGGNNGGGQPNNGGGNQPNNGGGNQPNNGGGNQPNNGGGNQPNNGGGNQPNNGGNQPPAGGNNNNGNPQTSTTLDPAVIARFDNDGQAQASAGQVASLTSTNNFINFCLTVPLPLTNGQQIEGGSCNPAPMGVIAAKARMPHSKFVNPPNGATIPAGTPFRIEMAIQNLETGQFVNPDVNYFSAPQQINGQGIIRGHSHVVIQKLDSLGQTTPLDPTRFNFFKGLNGAANNGILTADVPAPGLPAGFYRLSSINTAANHQPVLVAVAQHGALDDTVYFTVQ